jgi:hypothetical protein
MARPVRVQPDGSFGTIPARGAFMGNRGCLHDATGAIRRAWASRAWITCTLNERPDRGPHPFPAPGRWTPLFFLDEAVAAAAGHRPCALCRRAAYTAYLDAWQRAFGARPRAAKIDAALHAARRAPRPLVEAVSLPAGAFFRHAGQDWLVQDGLARPYRGEGYGPGDPLPRGKVTLLTPEPTLAVLRAGWRPCLSASDDRPGWAPFRLPVSARGRRLPEGATRPGFSPLSAQG